LPIERASNEDRLRCTVDYGEIAGQIVFLLKSCRFRLVETAAHALAKLLLTPPAGSTGRPAIESVKICLTKNEAFGGNGIPSIEIERPRGWLRLDQQSRPFGTVDVIHETKDVGIYRLNLKPRASIPLHIHETVHESEMVLGDGLLCQKKRAPKGTVHRWPL